MNYDDATILKTLKASKLPVEEQQKILDQVGVRVGEAIEAQLTDRQINEYKAIVDANQTVIFAWLDQNMSDYKETDLYKTAVTMHEDGFGDIQAEKVVASTGWIKANVPNADEIIAGVLEAYKQERAATV